MAFSIVEKKMKRLHNRINIHSQLRSIWILFNSVSITVDKAPNARDTDVAGDSFILFGVQLECPRCSDNDSINSKTIFSCNVPSSL